MPPLPRFGCKCRLFIILPPVWIASICKLNWRFHRNLSTSTSPNLRGEIYGFHLVAFPGLLSLSFSSYLYGCRVPRRRLHCSTPAALAGDEGFHLVKTRCTSVSGNRVVWNDSFALAPSLLRSFFLLLSSFFFARFRCFRFYRACFIPLLSHC